MLEVRRYLNTWATPWSVRRAMSRVTPRSAATGVKSVRREDVSRPAPSICFAPNMSAKYPLGMRVSIMP